MGGAMIMESARAMGTGEGRIAIIAFQLTMGIALIFFCRFREKTLRAGYFLYGRETRTLS